MTEPVEPVQVVAKTMTRTERMDLARMMRQRAKLAKAEAGQREKVLLVEVEEMIALEFEARDELWQDAVVAAEEAARKANDQIVAQCALLGIPAKHSPTLGLSWSARSGDFADRQRQADLRKLAEKRLAALTETAKREIDRKAIEIEEVLVTGSLESDQAQAFYAALPSVDELMPSLGLDDLGVKHWQPPEGIASDLLTPLTTTQRKRRQIWRALEANPGASDRAIAELIGCDHKTVAKYRRPGDELTSGGELPALDGEFPGDEES